LASGFILSKYRKGKEKGMRDNANEIKERIKTNVL
jgi:hypothetical protein